MSGQITLRAYFSTQAERFTQEDAERIGPELERLMHDGRRDLKDVVDAARPEDAPLHDYFTWDDATAAERFRQMEAGRMVRAIQINVKAGGQQTSIPVFTPLSIKVTPATGNDHSTASFPERPPAATVPLRRGPRTSSPVGPLAEAKPWATTVGRPHPPAHIEPEDADDEDQIIAAAHVGLLSWVRAYEKHADRSSFRSVFAPVFDAIEEARGRAGLDDDPMT